MAESEENGWMTVKNACEYLQVSQMTVFRWMKSGKLSYYKLGGSVRFKKENLDMAADKVTGNSEGTKSAGQCGQCGHAELVPGKMQSTGRVSFKPDKTKFWVFSESSVNVEAKMCPACGHLHLFADTEKMEKLSPDN
ncbi:MAG: helix-turn-helix domain-containing protein [Planctomycetes bacterium]|nr:helix-turn-helix domain-containing protein [Planctomycetota bacterium]